MNSKKKSQTSSMTGSSEASMLVEELEKLRQERRELEEKYRNTIEYANDAILTMDNKGRISSFNKKAEEMFGYDRAEVMDKPASLLLPTAKREEEKGKFQNMLLHFDNAHSGSLLEGLGLKKDGQRFPIEGSFFLIQPDSRYAVTGIIRDIAERKKMEEQFRASEERARVILNASPDLAMLVDNTGTPLECNEALCLHMTMKKDELIDKTPNDVFDEATVKERTRIFEQVIREGKPVHRQDINKGRWFDYSIHPIFDAQGKVIQAVIFAHDITALKQKEEEIAAARDKLKALAMEVTTIEESARRTFSNYLHDRIGQTLFVLKIRLEIIAKAEADRQGPEAWKEIFRLMEKAIGDTRALSYEMSPSILNELGFEAALEWLVDQTNSEHDLTVSFKKDGMVDLLDDTICTVLYRAVRELLTNVIKHAHAKHVSILMRQDDHQVVMDIKDDGAGFDTGSLKSLPDQNKGFGLFSIKERLQWHNGDMIITSTPGRGTQVTLRAPVRE
jgi:PAS domain S-box-containing protein